MSAPEIDANEARRRLQSKKLTKRQRYAHALQREKGEVRYRAVMQCADHGMTFIDTAVQVGLTAAGLRSLLARKFGSEAWPPEGHGK